MLKMLTRSLQRTAGGALCLHFSLTDPPPLRSHVRWQESAYMQAPCSGGFVLALLIVCAVVGCSQPETEVRREFSLGTNGTLLATFDSQRRVRELRQFKPDQSLKLKISLIYGERDIQQLSVYDPQDRKVWESTFTSNSDSGSGRSSDVPSPGWEIRMQSDWSGMPGDIHDTRSWFCGDDLLYRVHRTWPDDRSRVFYSVTGPSGVILFTNTYTEK